MKNYFYNLSEIPQKNHRLFQGINDCIKKAFDNPGKLIRCQAGSYYIVQDKELVQIEQLEEGPNKRQWIAKEASLTGPKWYSDPFTTLKQLQETFWRN